MNYRNILLFCGALLFIVFASLQINDATQYGNSDEWIWIALYALMASLSALLVWRKIAEKWLYSWAGFCWGCLLFRMQDTQGNLRFDWLHPANYWDASGTTMVQQANESGGLFILAVWASITIFLAKRNPG